MLVVGGATLSLLEYPWHMLKPRLCKVSCERQGALIVGDMGLVRGPFANWSSLREATEALPESNRRLARRVAMGGIYIQAFFAHIGFPGTASCPWCNPHNGGADFAELGQPHAPGHYSL